MTIYRNDNIVAIQAEYEVRFYYSEDGHISPYNYLSSVDGVVYRGESWDLTNKKYKEVWLNDIYEDDSEWELLR